MPAGGGARFAELSGWQVREDQPAIRRPPAGQVAASASMGMTLSFVELSLRQEIF